MKKQKAPIPEIPSNCYLIDSHCHLDMDWYKEDLNDVLTRAKAHGIQSIISIGIDEKSSCAAVELAKKYPMLKASVGIHPHDVAHIDDTTYSHLRQLVIENRDHIVAFGEIGLDYAKEYSAKDIQRHTFKEQLSLAKELALPVIIHDRDAHKDCLELLQAAAPFPHGGVMHCFSGDAHFAEKVLALGFLISIPGVVTFKNGKELQETVSQVPLESMLIETDGPFLAPVPWRGKRNEPSYLPYIAEKIAELKGVPIETVAKQTSLNTQRLFNFTSEQ